MSDAPKHTMFAQQALGLAELFQATFGDKPIGTDMKYRAELAAPEGPSTGGGTQAVQPIKLTPVQTGTTLVIGSANQVEKTAELRTYEYLVRWQQQRFKGVGELALDRAAYEELFQKLRTFFAGQQLRVTVVAAPSGPASSPAVGAASGSRSNLAVIVAGIAIGVLALGGLLFWLRR